MKEGPVSGIWAAVTDVSLPPFLKGYISLCASGSSMRTGSGSHPQQRPDAAPYKGADVVTWAQAVFDEVTDAGNH